MPSPLPSDPSRIAATAGGPRRAWPRIIRDSRGASSVEFSIVAMPFILLLLGLPQMGIYFATQSSLDAGMIAMGDLITNAFYSTSAPTPVDAATLKYLIVSKSGGMVRNDASLVVDARKLSSLGAAASPIAGTVDATSPKDVIVIRAQAAVTSVVPFMGTMYVRSSVILRRQAL